MFYREEDIHFPRTGLICMENAHSAGTVVPLENISQVHKFAKSVGVPTHLDGARIFNAAISIGKNPKEIAKYFDSVMFCFSKGLCAPVGSILVGDKSFIKRARKNRKLMGGGMRQVGYLAAPCIVALEKMIPRLKEDHKNAKYLAKALINTGYFNIFDDRLDINMVFFKIKSRIIKKKGYNEIQFIKFLYSKNIKISPSYAGEFRFVTHYYIDMEKIDYTVGIINQYFKGVCIN
jgi:threonine aldolase